MKLSSVTWQTILISTILSGYVPAYKVQSWISSHIRKSTMDMFPQRELSKKENGNCPLTAMNSSQNMWKQYVC